MAMTLAVNSLALMASETEKKVINLDMATRQAKTSSIVLNQSERQAALQGEEADNAYLLYGYDAYLQYNFQRQYTREQKFVIEKQIERNVRQLFDSLLVMDKKLALLNKEIELQEKTLKQTEIRQRLEHASLFEVDQQKLAYQELLENKREMELEKQTMHHDFYALTKYSLDRYDLELVENKYATFTFPGSLDALAGLRAEQSIDLWAVREQVELENLPIYSTDYLTILKKQESRTQAEENVKLTKDGLKEAIRSTYAGMKQVEENYLLLVETLQVQQTALLQQEIYLQKGMISQLDYEKGLLGYEKLELNAQELLNQYVDLKELIDRPYLISIRSGR